MKFIYGIYCSGNAGRLLQLAELHKEYIQKIDLVFYDGNNAEVIKKLTYFFSEKAIILTSKLDKSDFSRELLVNLLKFKIDYLFCFGKRVIDMQILNNYKNRIINFHPSILPAFKGINAIDQALSTSVQLLGNTAHFINSDIDSGPIILQSVMSRADFKSYEDVLDIQIPMLIRIWDLLENQQITIESDDKVVISSPIVTDKFYSS